MARDSIRKTIFGLAIWTPVALIVATQDPAFPVPHSIGDAFFFPAEFKHYVGNKLPLRDRLAELHSRTLFALRGPTATGQVIRGRDGWLFLRMSRADSEHGPGREKLDEYLATYNREAAVCRELGIQYRLLVIPAKENVYSEYLPERIGAWVTPETTMTPAGRFLITKGNDIPVVDLMKRFRREKSTADLYFKTDSHWNEFGGFVATEELMASLNPEHVPTPYRIEEHSTDGGNEAKILGIQETVREFYPRIVINDSRQATMADRSPIQMDTINLGGFDKASLKTVCPTAPFGSAMIFHDSFGVALVPFISRQFRKCTFVWHAFEPEFIQSDRPEFIISLRSTF